ncbi:acyltransferase family protein [Aeromonas hydrophila]|uniref:acyltransferase family protein n=1 Tax=Aeromonas hydrophila TaxID=644 RepID=UPI0022AF50DD|nr:acyltransferase [Aeromonas hydrophila]ELB2793008.1 acyltransferase [Aeromonas hydrophila]MCZ4332384.1 acyltransferase [Aeromonas hydrophila]
MKLQEAFTRDNNFTLLRLLAALSVLFGHSYALSIGVNGLEDPVSNILIKYWGESLPSLAVDLFFVTSGFLVTASYCQRDNLKVFVESRMLRIFPALIVAVILCVFVVGPISTTTSLFDYFSSPSTWSYLRHNIILLNGIQFDLPSVFMSNPYPMSVNGSLWTLPIELWMYIFVAFLGFSRVLMTRATYNLTLLVSILTYIYGGNEFLIFHDLRTAQLGLLFFFGGFFYINREAIPFSPIVLVGLGFITYLAKDSSSVLLFKGVFFSYLVLILALHPKLRLPSIDKHGDISYGLYIYAFPIQQLIALFITGITPLYMFILSSVITFSLAIISWRLIEKPALSLKGRISLVIFKKYELTTKA